MVLHPVCIDGAGVRIVVGAVEEDDLTGIALGFEDFFEVLLGSGRFGEDDGFFCCTEFLQFFEAFGERCKEFNAFGVFLDGAGKCGELLEFLFFFERLRAFFFGYGFGFVALCFVIFGPFVGEFFKAFVVLGYVVELDGGLALEVRVEFGGEFLECSLYGKG